MNYNECMEYINSFDRKGKRISDLSRAEKLMELVGNPQKELEFIHIAGTNGKGSMATMMAEILTAQGYKVGLFTSPFLIEYTDRIRINGENISKDKLCETVCKLKPAIENSSLRGDFSQFEITQAIAFTYYKEEKCDVVVLEAGLGGLVDCTNVIENPIVTLIGSVSYDHTAILGEALEEIAFQKAGIIKKNRPCVLSAGNAMSVVRVVRERAMEMTSQLCIPNLQLCRVMKMDLSGSVFSYKGEEYEVSMQGLHQVSNALTVIDAVKFVSEKLPVSRTAVLEGLKKARLVGRVEVISKNPLTILDGGHNPDGMKALSEVLKNTPKPIVAVVGMHSDKNCKNAVKNLVGVVDRFITVDGFSQMDIKKGELCELIKTVGGQAEIGETVESAVAEARELCGKGTAVICGSLYLVSYVHNSIDVAPNN